MSKWGSVATGMYVVALGAFELWVFGDAGRPPIIAAVVTIVAGVIAVVVPLFIRGFGVSTAVGAALVTTLVFVWAGFRWSGNDGQGLSWAYGAGLLHVLPLAWVGYMVLWQIADRRQLRGKLRRHPS